MEIGAELLISTIMKLVKKKFKKPWKVFPGRFGVLTGRPGVVMKNLKTPGKTRRVGRYQFSQTYQMQDCVPGLIY